MNSTTHADPVPATLVDDGPFDEGTAARTLALQLRHPGVPITLEQLAALRGDAHDIVDARVTILETARRRAIRMTSPPDWILFKAPDGAVTGYLQDVGCDRIRDVLGIEVFSVSDHERLTSADGASFVYIVRGNGRSLMTGRTVERMEGGRASTDEFCKGKTGAELDLAVRKAARANLDGGIVRRMAGLRSLPEAELIAAWEGTAKKVSDCHKGRGFGTFAERQGGAQDGAPDIPPPKCPICRPPVDCRWKMGTRGAYYFCPQFSKHPAGSDRVFIDAAKHERDYAAAAAGPAPTFDRQPGEEG